MKLSDNGKFNFEQDKQFYIKVGKKIKEARVTKVNEKAVSMFQSNIEKINF